MRFLVAVSAFAALASAAPAPWNDAETAFYAALGKAYNQERDANPNFPRSVPTNTLAGAVMPTGSS
jgi:hypothetical protein